MADDLDELVRDAAVENIQSFIKVRLDTQLIAVANSPVLRSSKWSPLFALCFAASNEKGALTALKIASNC